MVNEFNTILIMNEATISMLKEKNCNYEKNIKIREILKDRNFFNKVNKKDALEILKNVGVNDGMLEDTYVKLISA